MVDSMTRCLKISLKNFYVRLRHRFSFKLHSVDFFHILIISQFEYGYLQLKLSHYSICNTHAVMVSSMRWPHRNARPRMRAPILF